MGACVGMRGSRVKNIVRELNNEKVDIIRWSADVKEFVQEALKPAKVKSLDARARRRKSIHIKVDEDQLSLAIGKRGQNARLTSRLTGWDINIEKDQSAKEGRATKSRRKVAQPSPRRLKITDEQALAAGECGMTTPEVVASVEAQDIADVHRRRAERRHRHPHDGVATRKSMASTQ